MALPSGDKIKNAEQTRFVGPHSHKLESGFGSERRKLVWRVFIRKFGNDFFATEEMKLVFVKVNKLIGFTDEMHFNPASVDIIDCAVPPLIQIKVCAQFPVDAS